VKDLLFIGWQPVRSAYQPPVSSTFVSEQTSHQQSASSTFLSEQISTNHEPPAKRIGFRFSPERKLPWRQLQRVEHLGHRRPCAHLREGGTPTTPTAAAAAATPAPTSFRPNATLSLFGATHSSGSTAVPGDQLSTTTSLPMNENNDR
jgi:hypothetical protein